MALVVTEPGLSALHDLERLARLLGLFHLPMYVIINRCDLSPAVLSR
jgi:MinD superfamily P-loop ATPase